MKLPVLLVLLIFLVRAPANAQSPSPAPRPDINKLILAQVARVPQGGKYSANKLALLKLRTSGEVEFGKFFTIPRAPYPSFCSGATYLIFVRTIEGLRQQGLLSYDYYTINQLIIREQKDGEGIWGRWNANGPGTARLFHELDLGRNFTSFEQARPGDFLKIFWTKEVGKREHGHSVIYLGKTMKDGVPHVRFWSSNQPDGYGEKSVPRSEITYAIFSRLERPENLSRIRKIPALDPYLASLLTVRSSIAEAKRKCGI